MSWADRVMFVVWILLGLVILAELLQTARGASLEVQIAPRFGNASGQFDRAAFTNAAGETLSVTRADLLVSDFALRRADGAWLGKSNEVAFLHLAAEHTSFRVAGIPAGHYDQLRFRVGVPTELNHSDAAKYPADHPLNPNFNGLHWSWQGGYIFMALEGRWSAPGTESPSGYSLHLANDWNLTTVTLPVALELFRDVWLQLDFDLAGLLHSMSFAKDGTSTHSREGDPLAGTLAANLPKAFRVSRDGAGVP
ncbi:MAG TPA: MbnP family protein, partial [Verrucomicrobiae bacterium]